MHGGTPVTNSKYSKKVFHEVADCTLGRVASMDVGGYKLVVDMAGCEVLLQLGGGLIV